MGVTDRHPVVTGYPIIRVITGDRGDINIGELKYWSIFVIKISRVTCFSLRPQLSRGLMSMLFLSAPMMIGALG